MGEMQEAAFYDDHFREYKSRLLQSNWLGLYVLVAMWLKAREETQWDGGVLDLGCGNGHFAELLWARGFRHPYLGVDFSPTAIYQAEYNVINSNFSFVVDDLRNDLSGYFEDHPGTVVIMETLEHLENDLAVIRQLPEGRHVILSVPNYDSEGHVRSFGDAKAVFRRYKDLIVFRRSGRVDLSPPDRRQIFVVEGWRR